MDKSQFLELLDNASENGLFPYPQHERMSYGGMRVHAYRGEQGFALVYEMLMFDHEAQRIQQFHGFCNQVFIYASDGSTVEWDDEILPTPIERVSGEPSVSLTEDNDELIENRKERQKLNPQATSILVRDNKVAVPQDPAAYLAHKITPSNPISLTDLLRYLIATRRDEVFSTDAERAEVFPGMTKLLTLDKFRHYVLDDEAPSNTEAVQMLVDVLVTGDPSKYEPTEPPNT
jgi:hypothetical protein